MAGAPPASGTPAASLPEPDGDRIGVIFSDLIGRIRAIGERPEAALTCEGLLAAIGPGSHALAIFVFSLLNLLPGPPGFNSTLALVIIGLSALMLVGRPMRLWAPLGRVKLPAWIVLKLLGALAMIVGWIARVSGPRLVGLTAPALNPAIAAAGIVLGLFMLVPIPVTSFFPSLGLAMVCIGQLNRDGLLVVVGLLMGLLGIVVTALSVWILVRLALAIEQVIDLVPPAAAAVWPA